MSRTIFQLQRVATVGCTLLLLITGTCVHAQFNFRNVIHDGDGGTIDGLDSASCIIVSPDNNFLYVAGAADSAIAVFSRDRDSGVLTFKEVVRNGGVVNNSVDTIKGLAGVREIAISPDSDGQYLYAVSDVDNAIAMFSRNNDGTLTFKKAIKDGEKVEVDGVEKVVDGLGGACALAVSQDGFNVYVAAFADSAVSVFYVSEGTLSYVHTIKDSDSLKLAGANGVFVSQHNSEPDPKKGANYKYVYVTGNLDDGISVFKRDYRQQGKITETIQNINVNNWAEDTISGNIRPTDIVISNNGGSAYVSGYGGSSDSLFGNLSVFSIDIDKDSGELTLQQMFVDATSTIELEHTKINKVEGLGRLTSLAFRGKDFIFTTGDDSDGDTTKESYQPDYRIMSFQRKSDGSLDTSNYIGIYNNENGFTDLEKPKAIAFSTGSSNYAYVVATEKNALTTFHVLFPTIESISPIKGSVGDSITITGKDFGNAKNGSEVKFGDVPIFDDNTVSWSDKKIVVNVPKLAAGNLDVQVEVYKYSNTFSDTFKVIPKIKEFSPWVGKTGTKVSMKGSGFGTDSAGVDRKVFFGDTEVNEDSINWISFDSVAVFVPKLKDTAISLVVSVNKEADTSPIKFTIDNTVPTVTITPANNSIDIKVDAVITLYFREKLFTSENDSLNENNISNYINLLDRDADTVAYTTKFLDTTIIITPTPPLLYNNTYYIQIADSLQDLAGNFLLPDSSDFKTKLDTIGPIATLSFSDADGKVAIGQTVTITATFNEPIANDAMGIQFLFLEHTTEIYPMEKVADTDTVFAYVYIAGDGDGPVRVRLQTGTDAYGNPADSIQGNDTFFVDNSPPVPAFSPKDTTPGVDTATQITISFDEKVRNLDNSILDTENLKNIIVLSKLSGNREISVFFIVSYTDTSTTISIQPDGHLEDNQFYQLIIKNSLIEDQADNPVAQASVIFKTGTDMPQVIDTSSENFINQQGKGKIEITVKNAQLIKSAQFQYREIRSFGEWIDSIDLIELTGLPDKDIFTFTYPLVRINDPIGGEYHYIFTDYFDSIYQDTLYVYKKFENGLEIKVEEGKSQDYYNLISFPLVLDNSNVASVLKELGEYNKKKWRLFTIDNASRYLEYQTSGFQNFEPGKGYLLIFKDDAIDYINTTKGNAVEANKEKPFKIKIHKGWNLIGNPYNFDLPWDIVKHYQENEDASLPDTLKLYSENWEATSSVLPRLGGALVFVGAEIDSISIPVGTESDGSRTKQPKTGKFYWEVPLQVKQKNGDLQRTLSGFGMHPQASTSYDAFDWMTPPSLDQFLDINFYHPEYFYPKFTKDVVPLQDAYVWEFQVETSLKDDMLELSWKEKDMPADGKQIFLMDVGENKVIDMRAYQSYAFRTKGNNKFKIYFGTKEFIEDNLKPESISLSAGYPNPFSDKITFPFAIPPSESGYQVNITIYDISGKEVISLIDKKLKAGFYKTDWETTHSTGSKMKSGVYICELVAKHGKNTYKKQQRILLSNH